MFSPVSSRRPCVALHGVSIRPRRYGPISRRRYLQNHLLAASTKSTATKIEEKQKANRTPLLDALDIVSMVGTIGGAVMVVLGYDLVFASLPIGLPVAALIVGIHRERRRNQVRDAFEDMLMDDVTRQTIALETVQRELQSVSAKIDDLSKHRIRPFEEKLDRIEGTLISTSKTIRQISGGMKDLPGIVKRVSELQQQTVIYAVSTEFRALFEKWGTTQLQSISEVMSKMKFVQDAIDGLEAVDAVANAPYPDTSIPIDVTAERKDIQDSGSMLNKMRGVIDKEVSAVLKQLKENQVDMMQTLRDVKINPLPQVDYSFLEEQLERIEGVLDYLPQQISKTMQSDAETTPIKEMYQKQFATISAVVNNLETAIQELKKASSASNGASALELEGLESKWKQLQSMMMSLSGQISNVNERMEDIAQKSESMRTPSEDEAGPLVEVIGVEGIEFDETPIYFDSEAETNGEPPPSSTDDPQWDVVGDEDEIAFESSVTEMEQDAFEQEDKIDAPVFSQNGSQRREEPASDTRVSAGDVSRVGSAVVGLEYLKKGRIAIQDVKQLIMDYGEASRLLVSALEQFESILEVDPANIQCLGNCGNTLLALGEMKLNMAQDVAAEDASIQRKLEEESRQFLTLAGKRFKSLLENRPDDKRAYMNWAKGLCLRARISDNPSLQMQLYDAAIVKYEQILSFEPTFVDAMLFCGIALKESSQIPGGSPMELRSRLSRAIEYFESVGRLAPSSPLQFEAFQMKQNCSELLGSPTLI